jgi:Tol biopolymer transport system component
MTLSTRSVMARSAVPLLLAVACLTACGGASSGPSGGAPGGPTVTARTALALPRAALEGHILFTKTYPGDVQAVFTANADGQHERRLTDPGQVCCGLRLSPDHTRILVMPGSGAGPQPNPVTGGTISLNGSDFKPLVLTNPTLNLVPGAWSPDGTRIAFEGWEDGNPAVTGIYTARVSDGGDLVRLTTPGGLPHDTPLDYSPDGKRLVFYRAVRAEPNFPIDIGGSLWVVNVDGSDPRAIQTGGSPPAPWARWSPDGARIVFATQRTAPRGALWTVQLDGLQVTKLFEDAEGRFAVAPTWSPDAHHILFALDPRGQDAFDHPANGLYVIKSDGTGLTLVSGTPDFKSNPEWWG